MKHMNLLQQKWMIWSMQNIIAVSKGQMATEDIHFGYCTEIMVKSEGPTVDSTFDYEEFRNYLDGIGDSLLVVNDDEIIKVHVHTETQEKS